MPRRLTAATSGAAVFVVATALGLSDTSRSLDFLTARDVTATSAFALLTTVCWLALALVVAALVADVLRRPGTHPRRIPRTALIVLGGAVLLGLGAAHVRSGYSVCCATPQTAQQAAQLVR